MFAVGHLALGYMSSKASSKISKTDINLPLIFTLSILPDIDLIFLNSQHRGPTHSVVIITLLSLPFFIFYKKKLIPYFVAIIQHSLIGDLIAGTTQLFWPLSTEWYGIDLNMESPIEIVFEWAFFLLFLILIFELRDFKKLFVKNYANLLLILPGVTVGLPLIVTQVTPIQLYIPNAFFSIYFFISILSEFKEL